MAKKSLAGLRSATAVATKRRPTKVVRKLATPFARDAIEGLAGGLDVFGFTKGQFSFVDLIDAVLELTGPSRVTVATWTAASSDAAFLGDWCRQGRIKQFRLLIDYSFLTRRGGAEAVDAVIQNFGPDAVRVTRTHAKLGLVAGADATVAILTSMNLNKNPRFEYFHVTWDPGVVGLLSGLASEIWESPALAEAVKMRPQQHKNIFGEMGVESSPEPATRVGGAEIDVCLYPNNGRGRGRSRESVVDPNATLGLDGLRLDVLNGSSPLRPILRRGHGRH